MSPQKPDLHQPHAGARERARPVDLREPTVSVVLPTYNRQALIGRAIRSVLNQTYEDFELIVVDDGSRDATADEVQRFEDRRLRYVSLPANGGAGAARNAGIREGRGRFIAFQDSDDEWVPEKLERHMDAFATCAPEIGVVYSDMHRVLRDGTARYHRSPSVAPGALIDPATRFYRVCGLGIQSTVIRRECFARVGVFNEALPALEDLELFIRLSQAFPFHHLPAPLVRYHETDGLSNNMPAKLVARTLLLTLYQKELETRDGAFVTRELSSLRSLERRLERDSSRMRTRVMTETGETRTAPMGQGPDGQSLAASEIDISVCVCTFRRPAGLLRLLRSLRALDPATPPYEVIVVDNDDRRTAETVVDQARTEGLVVQYLVEPARGIARARNRSVGPARGEYIAFIDDDEEAHTEWLVQLWTEVIRSGADGGVGPVIPRFSEGTRRWLIEGGFFERPRPATGTILGWKMLRTGNALVRRRTLMALPGPFDETYNFTGGEDTDLFLRIVDSGSRFIAVDSAIVFEHLPPARTTPLWLLQRRFRVALGVARMAHTGRSARMGRGLWHLILALGWGLVGILLFPFSRIDGMKRLQLAARQLGRFAFFFGFSYRPYLGDTLP